jgi:hypothetical protein
MLNVNMLHIAYCKRQACPPVREGAPHQQTRNCLTNKNLVVSPRRVFYSKTD